MACEFCNSEKNLINVLTLDLVERNGEISTFIDCNFIEITTKKSGYILIPINYCPICGRNMLYIKKDKIK